MISINGILTFSIPLRIILEVNHIGYEIYVPLSTWERLPDINATVKLFIYAVYREDGHTLYGFKDFQDREFFRLIIEKVSGVGPKLALTLMSKMSTQHIRSAILTGDAGLLAKCPGIGKKTAERMILDLKDKLSKTEDVATSSLSIIPQTSNALQDAIAALVALGYKPSDAEKVVHKSLQKLGSDSNTEAIIKYSLTY